ncbi:MAG: fibronectin type III domain-containing protein [Bacteroidia bacterium]|nr:fibronectin type III domain-containing protein [Bacteroidia bacterium]MDW8159736.1 fibronectin type III domain-containing protein [Bacteroidia bacterium]
MPLFIKNQGQVWDSEKRGFYPDVLYYFQHQDLQLYFQINRFSYVFNRAEPVSFDGAGEPHINRSIKRYRLDWELINASSKAIVENLEKKDIDLNFYLGKSNKLIQVPTYGRLRYRNIYPGIDMVWYTVSEGENLQLKYDYILSPGADPALIRWQFHGIEKLMLTEKGGICAVTPAGSLCEAQPYAYQILNGKKKIVPIGYRIEKENIISFNIGEYNPLLPLIIDPAVEWSTYWGGAGADEIYDMAYEPTTNALWIVGATQSINFPVQLGWQMNNAGGQDVFISRHNATTGALQWATYLGGSGNDIAFSITLASQGFYVSGTTTSTNFPMGSGGYQTINQGNTDFFLSRFNSSGTLEWSTYLGGSGQEVTGRIALDSNENIYFCGRTNSMNFPVLNAEQPNNAGGLDAILAKFDSAGNLQWSTYFGGSQDDYGTMIAIQPNANRAALVGWTRSNNLPISGGFQPNYGGGFSDGYILYFDTQSGLKEWGTYFGGNDQDYVNGAAFNGNTLFFTAAGASTNIPLINAVTATLGGGLDVFIGSLQANTGVRNWVRPFGGNAEDNSRSLKIDEEGLLYVSGWTTSTNLPLLLPLQTANNGSFENFAAKFNPQNGATVWATYYGGSGEERLQASALAPGGILFIGGFTASTNYPTRNAIYAANQGNQDIFLTRFATCDIKPQPPVLTPRQACVGQTVTFSTTSLLASGQRLRWYDALDATTPLLEIVTPPFEITISSFPTNTTYYAAIYDANTGCASLRVAQPIANSINNTRIRNLPSVVCTTSPAITLEGEPTGGTFSGPGINGNIFYPQQLNPGRYEITYSGIFNGCAYQTSIFVTVERIVPRFISLPETTCTNLSRLILIAEPAGGNFSGPAVSGNIFQPAILSPGLYTITYSGTASNGCPYTTTRDIYVDTLNIELINLASDYCTTSSAIELVANPSNGVFSGAGISNNNIFTPSSLAPGQYPITYSGEFAGCPYSTTKIVRINAPIRSFSIGTNSPLCLGNQLNLQAPFIANASYQWSGPAAFSDTRPNPTISGVTTANGGEYSLSVVVPGCPTFFTTTFVSVHSLPPNVDINVFPGNPLCRGDNLLLVASSLPGGRYFWSGPNGFTASTPIVNRRSITSLEAGRYTLLLSVEGCTGSITQAIQIVVNTPPQVSVTSNSPVCENETLFLRARGAANALYLWSGPNGWQGFGEVNIIDTVSSNESGVYTLTAIVPGCPPATYTTNVVINSVPDTVIAFASSPICAGQALALTAFAPAEARLSWRGPNNFTSTSATPIITNVSLLASGAYTVTATVAGCPSISAVTEVVVVPIPATPIITGRTTICEGDTIHFAITTQPNVIYRWEGPSGLSIIGGGTLSLPNATAANAGTYSVYGILDGCTSGIARIPLNIIRRPAPLRVSYSGPVCAGGNFQLFAQTVTGITYRWRGPGGWRAFTQNPVYFNAPLSAAGMYTLTAAFGQCESQEATLQVEILPTIDPNAVTSNSPVCQGSVLRLSAPILAGGIYNWSGPAGFASTQSNPSRPNFSLAQAGTYSFIGIVGNCTTQKTVEVFHIPKPNSPSAGSNSPVCAGSFLSFTSSSVVGAAYLWQGPAGFSSTLQNPSIAAAETIHTGTYTLQVIVAGCTSDAVTLNARVWPRAEAQLLTPNVTICQGNTATLSFQLRGTGPWNINIQSGARIQVGSAASANPSNHSIQISPTTTTTYTIGEIVDANNCRFSLNKNAVVNVVPLPLASITISGRPCQGQSLELIGGEQSPEGSYFWEGPNGLVATTPNIRISSLSASQAGIYSLTRIIGECSSRVATFNLPLNTLPSATISSAVQNVCFQNPVSLPITFTGNSPWNLTYRINNQAPITITGITTSPYNLQITPQALGEIQVHLVNVTDNAACGDGTVNGIATLRVSDRPNLRVVSKTDANCGGVGGSVSLSATGGTGTNYRYSIDNIRFSTNNLFTNLAPGSYTFYVTDGVCLGAASVTINGTAGTVILSTQTTSNSITINWQPVPNTPSYNIRYRIVGSTVAPITINNVTGTVYTISGLTPGTRYEIEVQANCEGGGSSVWSEPIAAQTLGEAPPACAMPIGIVVDRITTTSARVTWSQVPGAICYVLSYGLLSQNPDNWVSAVLASNVTVSDILNLVPGQAYGVRLRTNCQICSSRSGNLSSWSSIQNFNTPLNREEIPSVANESITIFPNPGKDKFYLKFPIYKDEAILSVYSAAGSLVYQQRLQVLDGINQWLIDPGDLPVGVYKIVVQQHNWQKSASWVVVE